jgi:hypothetical protein
MAQKFLEVEISRREFMNVTLSVDDEDPRFKDLFTTDGKLAVQGHWGSLKPAVQEAIKDKYDNEWEADSEVDVEGLKIEPREEALKYKTFDAVTEKWLN